MDMMFPKGFEKSGYILQGDESEPNDMRLPFESLRWETSVGKMKLTDEQLSSVFNGNGGFTKPCLTTGKTYDELFYKKQYELVRSSLLSSLPLSFSLKITSPFLIISNGLHFSLSKTPSMSFFVRAVFKYSTTSTLFLEELNISNASLLFRHLGLW